MKYLFGLVTVILISCNTNSAGNHNAVGTTSMSKGEQLFRSNCASCHKCNENLIGPALSGVLSRWKSKELLYEYIRNPSAVIGKDQYAKDLLDRYKVIMNPFPQLSDDDIDEILKHCAD